MRGCFMILFVILGLSAIAGIVVGSIYDWRSRRGLCTFNCHGFHSTRQPGQTTTRSRTNRGSSSGRSSGSSRSGGSSGSSRGSSGRGGKLLAPDSPTNTTSINDEEFGTLTNASSLDTRARVQAMKRRDVAQDLDHAQYENILEFVQAQQLSADTSASPTEGFRKSKNLPANDPFCVEWATAASFERFVMFLEHPSWNCDNALHGSPF